jgi:hypothetical protein
VPRLDNLVNWPLSGKRAGRAGYNSPDYPVCTRLSGEPTALTSANGRRVINGGHVAASDCPVRHQTIWCAGQSKDAKVNSTVGLAGMERNRVLFIVQCAPDSPVHPRTEDNEGLPNEDQTTPMALEAIKGPHKSTEL